MMSKSTQQISICCTVNKEL